ncbi:hypothetical protein [Jeotgalibacillus soli]|uniref:hypothetical protein n=1 Tax=Jeotgalibacillus soli TaxID=889306 RepID=UPI000B1D22BC|nr:hypothetical protein [Jeotgalibacillus soli]
MKKKLMAFALFAAMVLAACSADNELKSHKQTLTMKQKKQKKRQLKKQQKSRHLI